MHEPHLKNIVARIYNCLVSAMSREATVPKMILIILENDLIDYLQYNDFGVSSMFGQIISNMASDMIQATKIFKEKYLPKKAFKKSWPQFIFVLPSTHVNYRDNTLRRKLATEMEKMLIYHPEAHAYKFPRADWDYERHHLVSENTGITEVGQRRLWRAVDKIIAAADEIIFKEQGNREAAYDPMYPAINTRRTTDDYHWNRDQGRWREWQQQRTHAPHTNRRILPQARDQ